MRVKHQEWRTDSFFSSLERKMIQNLHMQGKAFSMRVVPRIRTEIRPGIH